MEFNFESYEQIAAKVANRVLDEFEFNGKTIRAWAETLTYPKTNADRIRAMSDEELVSFLDDVLADRANAFAGGSLKYPYDIGAWLDWLRQEAEP